MRHPLKWQGSLLAQSMWAIPFLWASGHLAAFFWPGSLIGFSPSDSCFGENSLSLPPSLALWGPENQH
jgi:hypothetical protein